MKSHLAIEKHVVKITVLKKHYHPEYVELYTANPDEWSECTHFNIGDTFYTDPDLPWVMPEGFCHWGWVDIQKLVYGIARGGQKCFVSCCTDGYRPVIFALERV